MGEAARKEATYDDLYTVPENMVGEIIDGELYAMPRPSPRHSKASSVLGIEIGSPYQIGRGGPGGWLILDEVELQLGKNILVPDLAGWKKERLPELPETNYIAVPPDWICEILSPSTARLDKTKKMPIYAQYSVPFFWLVDPVHKTLDVLRLENKKWTIINSYTENDKVRAEPFQEIEIELANLWG